MAAQKKRARLAIVTPAPITTPAEPIDWTPERISRLVMNLVLLLPQGQGLVRAFWVAVCHCRDFAELRAKCEGMERIAHADTSEHMQTLWRDLMTGERGVN